MEEVPETWVGSEHDTNDCIQTLTSRSPWVLPEEGNPLCTGK